VLTVPGDHCNRMCNAHPIDETSLRRLPRWLSALLIAVASCVAHAQSQADKDSCVKKDPDEAIPACTRLITSEKLSQQELLIAFTNRGYAWGTKRDYDREIADYNEALRLDPRHAPAYNNRGLAWRNKGDHDRAIADYNEALRLNPKYAIAYNNRGFAWRVKRDYDRAIADFNEALLLNPRYALAYRNRGLAWGSKREHDRAIADFNEALRLNPQDAQAYRSRGYAWSQKRDYTRAIADFNEALRIAPQDPSVHNGAAWLLATAPVATARNGARAVEHARKAAELSEWKAASILDTLAAAYAEAGNFSDAVRWQERALESPEFVKTLGEGARERLALYRKSQPYRDVPKP
jgi:tetratricopeptide (TPR) repeat protein